MGIGARDLAHRRAQLAGLDQGPSSRSPEYRHPAYAYQTAPYLYFNVSYARNMMTLRDPSAPELGPLTPRALAGRVWATSALCRAPSAEP